MALAWVGEASSKSTQQLLELVSDPIFSKPKAVEAARSELEKRGVAIPSLRVGGWLLWFCIITTFGPLKNLLIHNQHLTNLPGSLALQDQPVSALQLGVYILQILVGIYVWTKGRFSIPLLRVFLAIWLLWAVFGAIHLAVRLGYEGQGLLLLVASGVIMPVIWWLYFRTSSRVRWTFGRNI